MLLDKPTLDSTGEIESFVVAAGDVPVLPGHHFVSHPGFTRVLAAVRNAEFGLLRAVHADLVTGGGESAGAGELRNIGVHLIELIRLLTGPATVGLQAHATADGAAWSFLGKTDRGVVVSHHVSRAGAGEGTQQLRARVRLTGTHGFVLLDLLKPSIDIRSIAGDRQLPYVEGSVVAHLRRLAALADGGRPAAPARDLVTLSAALDGIAESAATGTPTSITW